MTRITAGYVPLIDCAPLVIAHELGFDRHHGFTLDIFREPSWASIRDRMAIAAFDCAHMLAPMPLASSLGLTGPQLDVLVPTILNLNGNVIVASNALLSEMIAAEPAATRAGGRQSAHAIAAVVRQRAAAGLKQLTFGMVFPFSCHNYDLRYWLALAGVDPDRDVGLIVVPPPLLADHLAEGHIDGFCVGAPWGMVSAAAGRGQIIATKKQLWPGSPEKVLGMRRDWALREPGARDAVIRAIDDASRWLALPANRLEAAQILARPEHIGLPVDLLIPALVGELPRGAGLPAIHDPEFIVFPTGTDSRPRHDFALWLLSQMVRWGQASNIDNPLEIARRVYRPDLHEAALGLTAPPEPLLPMTVFESEIFSPTI